MLRTVGRFATALLIVATVLMLFYMYPLSSGSNHAKLVAPEQVRVAGVSDGIEVSWKPLPQALYYAVFWGTEKGNYRNLYTTSRPKVLIANLRKGELYYIAVTTWTPSGESNYSVEQVVVNDDIPSHAQAHLAKANEFLQRGAFPEAYAHISAAVRLDPANPEAYKDRGLLFEKIARPDLAKQDYATAEKLYKNKPISLMRTRQSGSY